MPGILSEEKPSPEDAHVNGGGASNGDESSCPVKEGSGGVAEQMCPFHRNSNSPDSELNHSSSTLSTSASSEGETLDLKEKEDGGEKGKGEGKEDGGGAQEEGERKSNKKKVVDIAAFDLHLLLPGVTQPFDVTLSSQDTVHDLLQCVADRPGCCYRTCLSVRLRGKRLDSFSELGTVEGLCDGDTVELVEELYAQRDVRMHIQRLRDLLAANPFGQSLTSSEGLSLSFLSAITLKEPAGNGTLDLTDPAQLEPPPYCLPHDEPHPPPLTPIYPTNLEAHFKVPECLKAMSYSMWNPPPSHRKMKGDLLYLDVTTLEGQEHYVTACPTGFYLNKSTSRELFDPSPRKVAHHSTHLVGLLTQISPLFKKNFAQLLKFSEKRHVFEILPVPYPVTPWVVPQPEHKPVNFRIDEGVALKAAPDEQILGQLRDWNEELQSTRELPTATTSHKIFRDRALFKIHCEFVHTARQGAVAVVDGYIPPLNPGEEEKLRIYLWNNIFFSLAFDGRDHFKDFGRDEAAHATAAGDLRGAATLEAFDHLYNQGLYTLGTVLVDYRGFRVICQSIIPGLLQREQDSAVVYGSIDNGRNISSHPKFRELLKKLGTDLHIKEHKLLTDSNEVVILPSSVEVKGIVGTDSRHYILDLYRIFPPDANYMELPEGSKYRHKLSVLRYELLESFLNYRYVLFLKLAREKACELKVIQDLQKNFEAQAKEAKESEEMLKSSKLEDRDREGKKENKKEVEEEEKEVRPSQIEEESSPGYKSFDASNDTKQTSTPTKVVDERSNSTATNQHQSESALINQEQPDNISVNQKQSPDQTEHPPASQERSQVTTSPPVDQSDHSSPLVDQSDNSQEQLEKTAAGQEQSESLAQEISDNTFDQEHLDCGPTNQQLDNTLVYLEQLESVPANQEPSESVPANQGQSSESVPANQEPSESVPANQGQSSESVPANQEPSESVPANQGQSSESVPAKQEPSESVPANQGESSESVPANQGQSEDTSSAPTDQEQFESNELQDHIPVSGKDASVSPPPAEQNTDHFLSFPKAVQSAVASDMPTLLILSNGTSRSEQESLVLQALAGSSDLCLVDGLQIFTEEKEVGPEIPVAVGEELTESSAQGEDFGLEDEANPYPEVLTALKEAAREAGSTNPDDFDVQFNVDIFSPGLKHGDPEEVLEKDRHLARSAALFLTHSVIPRLVRDCIQLVAVPVDGESLKQAMHTRGVNMRYLGNVAELAAKRDDLKHLLLLCVSEMIVRIAKRNLKKLLQDTPIQKMSEAIAHFLNCFLGETETENEEPRKKHKRKKGLRGLNHSDIPHLKLTPEGVWLQIVEEVGWYYRYTLEQPSLNEACNKFGIQKLSLLRELCRKTGVQLVLQEYDFSAKPTFTEDDIASLFPLVKHTDFRPAEGVALFELAQTKLNSGNIQVALEMFSEALQVFIQVYGPLHVDIANCYRQIARIHHLVNEPVLALSFQHKATLVSERVLGIDHPDTITAYINLALYCHSTQQLSAGLRLLYRARYLLKLLYGEDHPELATCDSNIALLLHSIKDYDNSLAFLLNALKIHEKYHGKQSLQTALSHHLIARVQSFLGDFRAALHHEKLTYSIYHKKFGTDHERAKESWSCLQELTEKAVTMQKTICEMTGKGRTKVNVDLPGSWGDVVSMVNSSDHHAPRHQLRGQRPPHTKPHVVRKRVKQNSKASSADKASQD